ncbi:preprotein translocase subunit SecE [Buchnera aphidicola (Takecallis taiwana)]|uniref:preprotein translocase subunit SecE n=1 Tax=Buchnera aphidicola TaxID=9 RepID=UPI0031B69224
MKILYFIQRLKNEINNICWPEYTTTLQMTFTIFSVSTILSLVLWVIDKTLFFIISSIINIRF